MPFDASLKPVNLLLALLWLLLFPAMSRALEPGEVLVIANVRANDSLELAGHYMRQRHIPLSHLVRLDTTWQEHCSREEYDKAIRKPVRQALANLGETSRIRCLAVLYGVPLAIRPPDRKDDGQRLRLKERLRLLNMSEAPPGENSAAALKAERERIEMELAQRERMDSRAAVDSELALVLTESYPLEGWLPNPYFVGIAQQQQTLLKRDAVLMVSRLDGPDPATVRRLIDDALAAEKEGLHGLACFDARWPKPGEKQLGSGYALYDAALHAAAEGLRGRMEVRLDARGELFQPGDCPKAALYSGWYSLGRYVDAFDWVRGAVGYHIASAECATLKQKDSQVWCKRMIEDGVAATIGPVYEPYVQAFPPPDLFFGVLTEGYLTLAESYLVSLPYLSWQMVLIGDPLYKPFSPR